MRPGLTPAVIAELEARENRPFYIFEADFAGGWRRFCSLAHDIEWNGQTYIGNGTFTGYRGYKETLDVGSSGIEITMSGVTNELLVTALDSTMQGKPAHLYLGFLNVSGAIIDHPFIIFSGIVDVPTIVEQADSSDLVFALESRFALYDRPKGYRYNQETQKHLYPGDTGFQYALRINQSERNWGGKTSEPSAAAQGRSRQNDQNKRSGGKARGEN
jgi:hypothetical protein